MNETITDHSLQLSEEMIIVIAIWLSGNGYTKDISTKPFKLSTLVTCFIELGILRSKPALIWRQLKRTSIPASFPASQWGEMALCVLGACRPSAHWQASAERWIDSNREKLIAVDALNPDAPRLSGIEDRFYHRLDG